MLIFTALGLELWNLSGGEVPTFALWPRLIMIERAILIAHMIEGLIAAVYAPSRQESSLRYGLYTFFTGFPSLIDLLRR